MQQVIELFPIGEFFISTLYQILIYRVRASMSIFSKNLVAASLEPLLLSLLSEGEMYGYEIIQRVEELSEGKIRWTASKLYPLLHHLENEGLVQARWYPSESGPDRKYYSMTRKGQVGLEAAKRDWLEINAILARLWGPGFTLTQTSPA